MISAVLVAALVVGPVLDPLEELRACTSTLVREHALRLDCEARPPVVEVRTPGWVWPAAAAVAVLAFGVGAWAGLEARR